MIISASRRTDIPSYFSDWFFNRIREEYVYVRNPMNARQISRLSLAPDAVDAIVFWTKNPLPMLDRLSLLDHYPYYFQFTLTSYGQDLEPGIPNKSSRIIPAFRELSNRLGAERVIWRYDPILLTDKYTMEYHITYFEEIARRLSGYTTKCIISFLDLYRSTAANMRPYSLRPIQEAELYTLAQRFASIGEQFHISIETCAETVDLSQFGISHGHCIDPTLLENLLGCKLMAEKDKNQRKACGCMTSVDIGMYNTCKNGCAYCYANHSSNAAARAFALHDPSSPLISGTVHPDDIVTERKITSCKLNQMTLF